MKKKHCAGAAALLSLVLGLGSLMGCSKTVKTEDYATTVVATFGNEKIYLDEANFLAKSEQYLMESYYSMITGTVDFWSYDVGNGKTIEETTKEGVMARILQTRILDSKAEEYGISLSEDDEAKIEEAIAQYKENLQDGALEKMGGTDELLSKVYHDNALANRVYEYMVADIDTDVDREEQRQVKVSYLKFDKTQTEDETSTDTESESATETESASETETEAETAYEDTEEYAEMEQLAEQAVADLKSGESMDDVKADLEADDTLTVTQKTESFGKTDHDNAFGTASFELQTGEYATAYVEEDGWYVIYCEEYEDEAATDDAVQSVLNTRKSDMFNTKYEQLKAEAPKFKVDEDVWATVTMSTALYEIPETTAADETETETEAASSEAESETETTAESESETETATETESESAAE